MVALRVKLAKFLPLKYFTKKYSSNFFDKTLLSAVIHFQMTHIDKEGFFLQSDGIVGPKTWWALYNQSGSSQRSFIDAAIPNGLPDYRVKYLEFAIKEYMMNVYEIPDGSNSGPRINVYTNNSPAPWCGKFVSFVETNYDENIKSNPFGRSREGSTAKMIEVAKEKNMYHLLGNYIPIPGDKGFHRYKNSSGKYTGLGHTWILLRISIDSSRKLLAVNTLEGNAGNRLKLGYREISKERFLDGFANTFMESEEVIENILKNLELGTITPKQLLDGRTR